MPLFRGCLRLPPGKHFLGSSVGIALFDLCYLDYNGAAEEDPPLSDLFHTPAAYSVSLWAGLMPSEKYNPFHSGSIPAISTSVVQCLQSNWSFQISVAAAKAKQWSSEVSSPTIRKL